MIKVVIADDEKRILRLIQKIINWEELGLDVVGTAKNGIEALEVIKEKDPHIVITDIRMPGYEGLELIERAKQINRDLVFIIISGYGQFEYAKKAIEFGVKDYLLKPINKEELTQTLINAKKIIEENNFISVKEDINIIRKSFIDRYLFSNEKLKDINISQVNERYHFKFNVGYFSVILFKIDYPNSLNRKIDGVINSIISTTEREFKNTNTEKEIVVKKDNIYLILNYARNEQGIVENSIEKIYYKVSEYFNYFKEVQVTIAYGKKVDRIEDLDRSFQTANLVIEDRIIKGRNKKYIYSKSLPLEKEIEDKFHSFLRRFIKNVELLDSKSIEYSLLHFKDEITRTSVSGYDLKDFLKEIFKAYYLTLKNNKYKNSKTTKEYRNIEHIIETSYCVDKLFNDLLEHVLNDLNLITNKVTRNNLQQIIKAKKYIEKNYMQNIKLEDLGQDIGLNPTYLSSIFKKATGASFIEYLTKVRVEKAKELLKDSDLKIQDISFMIGYNDSKYFTKIFTKYSGLKPNEYRKTLYR